MNDYGVAVGLEEGAESPLAFVDDGVSRQSFVDSFNGYGVLINNAGTIVLHEVVDETVVPYLLEGETLTALAPFGGGFTYARDMNDFGTVVGWGESAGGYRALIWERGLVRDITPADENHCAAGGVNDYEEVVIKCQGINTTSNYLYVDGETTCLGNLGANGATVNDINNDGQITGWLYINDDERAVAAFLATPSS